MSDDEVFDDMMSILDPSHIAPPKYRMISPLYKKDYCAQLVEYMYHGHSFKGALGRMGIIESTGKNWLKLYPEWAAARELGAQCGLSRLEAVLNKMATEEPHDEDAKKRLTGNLKAIIFTLKTLHKEVFSEHMQEGTDSNSDSEKSEEMVNDELSARLETFRRNFGESDDKRQLGSHAGSTGDVREKAKRGRKKGSVDVL